ncbi:ArnT family glycosyltransferase [Mucilaginibacter glaciei]|uniref:Glycosyltransferase family 39 protein n=1 Tax=Mucilaginibacter glaciei TaxID=2772109 RepID=A0A926S089_9SPHI|nr:glycosyltransferase family 39 protein [Mucilaginibacter glaciei]MBD1392680.1 glycosyltransferase family 39 protein [Mucilaginibacter glaciei]
MNNNNKPFYLILFVLALVVNFIGINNDFFSDDPGLYASIAKAMVYKKDLWQLYSYNVDWLDKPHFPFWAAFVSFKIFGVSVWAYRLPALLFFLLSLLYTYLFTRRYYTKEIAFTAVLIVMTAQHVLISNVDVRAEPYLMGLVIGSIYHIAKLYDRYSLTDLLLAALLTACAIMTKGIFVIVVIYGSLLGQLILQGEFMNLFKVKWWALFLLTFLFCLPELYALYIQFDLHPEKTVFGRNGVSGIKWFLWDSQFGRFINSGPIRQQKSGDVFFFVHTLLWAFAPWCLFFYYALYKSVKNIRQKVRLNEYYTLSGGLLLLLLFSLSRFQLPFYTNAIFPLFAIITAPYFYKQLLKAANIYWGIVQWIGVILLPIIAIGVHLYLKPDNSLWFIVDCFLFGSLAIAIIIKVPAVKQRVFLLSCCAVLFANFYINTTFFKILASYNGQITAAKFANLAQNNNQQLYSVNPANNVFQFYCSRQVNFVRLDLFKNYPAGKKSLFFLSQLSVDYLVKTGVSFTVVKAFSNYPQENILPAFINKETRSKTLDRVYLITR